MKRVLCIAGLVLIFLIPAPIILKFYAVYPDTFNLWDIESKTYRPITLYACAERWPYSNVWHAYYHAPNRKKAEIWLAERRRFWSMVEIIGERQFRPTKPADSQKTIIAGVYG